MGRHSFRLILFWSIFHNFFSPRYVNREPKFILQSLWNGNVFFLHLYSCALADVRLGFSILHNPFHSCFPIIYLSSHVSYFLPFLSHNLLHLLNQSSLVFPSFHAPPVGSCFMSSLIFSFLYPVSHYPSKVFHFYRGSLTCFFYSRVFAGV